MSTQPFQPMRESTTNSMAHQIPPPTNDTPIFTPSVSIASVERPTGITRKRSHYEAGMHVDLDEAPMPNIQEQQLGFGNTIDAAQQGYDVDGGSRSRVRLMEDDAAQGNTDRNQRPAMRSTKSQRLARSSSRSPLSFNVLKAECPIDPAEEGYNKPPEIDNFSIQLGIGWKRISESEHLQAAARGWARFIENHYPITNVCVRLESRALQSYLVQSDSGFYLFSENLRQCRLVSNNIVGALQNLQNNPPIFDGAQTCYATETTTTNTGATDHAHATNDTEMTSDC